LQRAAGRIQKTQKDLLLKRFAKELVRQGLAKRIEETVRRKIRIGLNLENIYFGVHRVGYDKLARRGVPKMSKDYDVVIIGSGPAGLTAGLYCGRARLKTMIIEKGNLGGAIIDANWVENWPGVEQGISGADLAGNMLSQVMQYEVDIASAIEVKAIELVEEDRRRVLTTGETYTAKVVIIAGGTRPKKLNIPGEEQFIHQGISYCVMCDGAPFAGKDIAILGGGDNGITGALYMARLGCKIHLIEALPEITASKVLQEKLNEISGAQVWCSTVAEGIDIDGKTKILKLRHTGSNESSKLSVEGVFILVGREPETEYLRGMIILDEAGFIKATNRMETNIAGIFAAGDIRSGSVMQSISAAGDGATAAITASRYINARSW
jgi:thioredoxin reductase (NADPH)